MNKGAKTRHAILDRALRLASVVGLDGLTIGGLAAETGLSKSGLFLHFGSKEKLQIAVLDAAAERFTRDVMVPLRRTPAGLPRLRALFENWLAWGKASDLPGGCVFQTAAIEFDDREGAVRDVLVTMQRNWHERIARLADRARATGDLRPDFDPHQFAHELHAIILGCYHAHRLLRDPDAETRARRSFEALLDRAKSTTPLTATA
ncbi:MAG: TetR/AcrR family transcriptional regulator [Alphaproteobacteria bacterium]|nr:TetR/AcrR family transcriptional regulator [Alphaproteobacteria bacterium]